MKNYLPEIRKTLKLICILEKKHGIKINSDVKEELLYCGVAQSDIIATLAIDVEAHFGKPFKPAGETAYLKNFFDKFVREIGGIQKGQTLYRKEINDQVFMYCSFWPWGTKPVKTSVRIGLICFGADERKFFLEELKNEF